MPSTSTRGVQVKAEAMAEVMVAKAKARINIDLNQKADPQATVPLWLQSPSQEMQGIWKIMLLLPQKMPLFPELDLNNVVTPHPYQNLMVLDNHAVIY